jgi:tRNA/rRNA methyltransferase
VIRIPTVRDFPVLNLTQSIAILLGYLSLEVEKPDPSAPLPAVESVVAGLMRHLDRALETIGFNDPANPQRILTKLRRLFGRAGITDNEVKILRGMCRQMEWAARTDPRVVAGSKATLDPPGSADDRSR